MVMFERIVVKSPYGCEVWALKGSQKRVDVLENEVLERVDVLEIKC